MSTEPLLIADGLQVSYGTSQALFGLDLKVRRGQVMALLGRNGAGKTTTFRALMGILPPTAGSIRLSGRSIEGQPPYVVSQAGVGYVPEDRQIFTAQTVQENLEIGEKRGWSGGRQWTIDRIYDLFPVLKERRHGSAGNLSGGEQQMLSIARTLMGNPEILLLDEPSEGLAPIIVRQIAEVVLSFRRSGLTVLLAEQNTQFCLKIATDVSIIAKGRIVYEADIDAFGHDEVVKMQYLSA